MFEVFEPWLTVILFNDSESHVCAVLVARYCEREVKVAFRVQIKNLQWWVVFQRQVVNVFVLVMLFWVWLVMVLSLRRWNDVLEEHCCRDWDKVLEEEWCSHWEVSKWYELCLLSVEIDEAADWIRVCIQRKVDKARLSFPFDTFPPFTLLSILAVKETAQDQWLGFKYFTLILQQADLSLFRPFELRCLALLVKLVVNDRPDLNRFKAASLKGDNHGWLWLDRQRVSHCNFRSRLWLLLEALLKFVLELDGFNSNQWMWHIPMILILLDFHHRIRFFPLLVRNAKLDFYRNLEIVCHLHRWPHN